jgi:hypothetical protein
VPLFSANENSILPQDDYLRDHVRLSTFTGYDDDILIFLTSSILAFSKFGHLVTVMITPDAQKVLDKPDWRPTLVKLLKTKLVVILEDEKSFLCLNIVKKDIDKMYYTIELNSTKDKIYKSVEGLCSVDMDSKGNLYQMGTKRTQSGKFDVQLKINDSPQKKVSEMISDIKLRQGEQENKKAKESDRAMSEFQMNLVDHDFESDQYTFKIINDRYVVVTNGQGIYYTDLNAEREQHEMIMLKTKLDDGKIASIHSTSANNLIQFVYSSFKNHHQTWVITWDLEKNIDFSVVKINENLGSDNIRVFSGVQ